MSERKLDVIFICTGNSARSIIAEAILARIGIGRFNAFSAGTRPTGAVNPFALDLLTRLGHDVSGLRSKNIDEFVGPDAPAMDFVFTVCDSAASEECPIWPGGPVSAHWGMPDPAAVEGTDAEKRLAFRRTYDALKRRLEAFVALTLEVSDPRSLQARLDDIGADGAGEATG